MPRMRLLASLFCVISCVMAVAQSPCPTTALSNKVICTVPQVFGPNGLGHPPLAANTFHDVHFNADFQSSFTPLNSAIGTQLSLLQLASPASGILFTFDRTLGVVQRSNESFGPILSERSETIGRHKLFVAVTYQYFKFDTLDGINLSSIPAVFQHIDTPSCLIGPANTPNRCVPVTSQLVNGQPTYTNNGTPSYEKEYITTNNSIDLKVHQVTLFGTFGITSRIDASVAIPILDVRLGAFSSAHINAISVPPGDTTVSDYLHRFCQSQICLDQSFSNVHTATGIGDVTFRVKGTLWKGERAGIALGADLRAPTGDELNFLGSGAWGFKPFIAASYRARVSPHFNTGFEWNGSSILAGDVATGAKGRLPREFFYSGGVDVGVTHRLTVAVDLLGARVFNTFGLIPVTFTDQGDTTGVHRSVPDVFDVQQSFNMDDMSLGVKYSPIGNLLVTANVQFKLNDGGLRAKAVPLAGVSYTF